MKISKADKTTPSHRPCRASHGNITGRSKSAGTENKTLFGYRNTLRKSWVSQGTSYSLLNRRWTNSKYDFIMIMWLHAWCLQTEDLSLTSLKILNKSENECVNSANFCPVLFLLILCLGNRNHWDASTRDSPHKSVRIEGERQKSLKLSSRVKKIIIFRNFQFLDEVELIKSFLLKKFQEKMFFLCKLMESKRFFYANYFNWSLTSPVILDTHAAVEPS